MRIAIIGTRGYPYVYSGYETFVKEISERFIKNNISVTIYCHKGLFEDRPKKINGIDLVYLPTIESKSLSQFIHSFFSIIHFCFSDIKLLLVVNVANAPFGFITRLFGKKTLINVDGLEWKRPKWKGLGSKYFLFCAKIVKYSFNKIITDSFEMQKIYNGDFNTSSDVITYGPIKDPVDSSKILNKYNLRSHNYYFILGRLIPDNNADFIVKGFLKSNSKKKLLIVGDVPNQSKYSNTIKKYKSDSIIFTGYINDDIELSDLYKNCFAYFHGHEFGGTNPTLINALNFNCIILALNTKFNKEMLSDGKYGYLFNKKLDSLVSLLNKVDSGNARINDNKVSKKKFVDINYNWDLISEKYLEIFRNI
jgi:glycosyltransferase involved in cell wall biosynthesis